MRLDWQSFAPNPWFQLCAMVAVLSGGTTIYNLTQRPEPGGGGGTPPAPAPPPLSIATPKPPPMLKAKTRGQWIVDANGAADSDSADLRAVTANLSDGDTVTLRAGSYEGGINITKSVHFIGQGADLAAASIHASFQDTITASGKSVSFDNLSISLDWPGDLLHALHCLGESHVELNRTLIHSKARFAVLVSNNAVLNARDSTFQTWGDGCGLKFENDSRGSMLRCAFSSNRWGLEALNSAQARATSCAFEKNGLPNGEGSILVAAGVQAHIDADQCQFTGNTSSLRAIESGSLSITNSSFKDNGITGDLSDKSDALVSVKTGGKALLSNVTFESNKQGVSVEGAGSLTISGCHFANTGIRTENARFQYLSNAISASGQGSSVKVDQGTVINNTTTNGIVIVEGAKLTLDDASVEGNGIDGLWVGNNKGGATAEVRHGKFISNANGVECGFGSSGTIQDCQIIGNASAGIWLGGANTKISISNCEFRGHKGSALWIVGFAEGQATGCVFDGNGCGAQAGVSRKADQAGAMTLADCTITNNSICGIAACTKSGVLLRDLHFGGNHKPDIYKERSAVVRDDSKKSR